jgi:excisionase family DNA binding protein
MKAPVSSLSMAEPEKLLIAKDVAELLKVKPAYVLKLARQGLIKSVKINRYVRFRPSAVDDYIDSITD